MSRDLSDLAKRLEQSKSRELEQVKEIEREKLIELSQSLSESLKSELSTIEGDILRRTENLGKKLSEERKRIYKEQKEGLSKLDTVLQELQDRAEKLKKQRSTSWLIWFIPLLLIFTAAGSGWAIKHLTDKPIILREPTEEQKREYTNQYIDKNFIVEKTSRGFELIKREE